MTLVVYKGSGTIEVFTGLVDILLTTIDCEVFSGFFAVKNLDITEDIVLSILGFSSSAGSITVGASSTLLSILVSICYYTSLSSRIFAVSIYGFLYFSFLAVASF